MTRLIGNRVRGLLHGLAFGALATAAAAATVNAQATREFTLDVRPWSVDVAVAWPVSGPHMWGFSVGGGPDDFNRTFSPEVVDTISTYVTLEQIVRAGPFYRYESGRRFSADVGMRVALGGVRGVSGSPDLVTGVYGAAFVGGRRIRVGPRLFIGTTLGSDTPTIVHVDWLTARLRAPF